MLELSEEASFLLETLKHLVAALDAIRAENLDGHVALEAPVERPEDKARTTAPEQPTLDEPLVLEEAIHRARTPLALETCSRDVIVTKDRVSRRWRFAFRSPSKRYGTRTACNIATHSHQV
jgi:hypothetical protein